ncbi:hypothetical protein MesoLj113a_33760 [Mesorhizobium sp. 113-1-2]|nr:hypothetical protein MesoLj113a_33760 [Mesorhizobium sp. 113-1-2]
MLAMMLSWGYGSRIATFQARDEWADQKDTWLRCFFGWLASEGQGRRDSTPSVLPDISPARGEIGNFT